MALSEAICSQPWDQNLELVLLDHGLYKDLRDSFRYALPVKFLFSSKKKHLLLGFLLKTKKQQIGLFGIVARSHQRARGGGGEVRTTARG